MQRLWFLRRKKPRASKPEPIGCCQCWKASPHLMGEGHKQSALTLFCRVALLNVACPRAESSCQGTARVALGSGAISPDGIMDQQAIHILALCRHLDRSKTSCVAVPRIIDVLLMSRSTRFCRPCPSFLLSTWGISIADSGGSQLASFGFRPG